MSDITQKSIGELIDQLITADLKCFNAQEKVSSLDQSIALAAARMAQEMNKRRCDLIRAIDRKLGDSNISPTTKTY